MTTTSPRYYLDPEEEEEEVGDFANGTDMPEYDHTIPSSPPYTPSSDFRYVVGGDSLALIEYILKKVSRPYRKEPKFSQFANAAIWVLQDRALLFKTQFPKTIQIMTQHILGSFLFGISPLKDSKSQYDYIRYFTTNKGVSRSHDSYYESKIIKELTINNVVLC